MSKRVKRQANPENYLELGQILKAWREKKFSSSLALFKEHSFSFSYSTYASFENGHNIPSVPQLCELAAYYGEPAHDALLTWARVQMPTPELRGLFRSRNPNARREKQAPQPPNLDTVWVLNPADLAHLEKFPWFVENFRALCAAHPHGIPLENIARKDKTEKQLLRDCLQFWLDTGVMQIEKKQLRLVRPDIHIPNNDAGKRIRRAVMQETFQELMRKMGEEKSSVDIKFHFNAARAFTPPQAKRWQERLELMQEEYYALPFSQPDGEKAVVDQEIFSFLVLFAKR